MLMFIAQMTLLLNNMAFTLFAILFLLNKLPATEYGILMYVLGLAAWMAVVMEYGFSLSMPKHLGQCKSNGARVSDIITSVLSARVMLLGVMTVLVIILMFLIGIPVFSIILGGALGGLQGGLPLWYYQGKRDLLLIALIDALFIVTGMALVFYASEVFVLSVTEILMIFLGVKTASLLVTNTIMILNAKLERVFDFTKGYSLLRAEYKTFVFCLSGSLYTSFNVVILAFFVSPALIGVYTSIERVIRICTSMIAPMTRALYPFMISQFKGSPAEAMRWWKIILVIYAVSGMLVAVAGLFWADTWMAWLFGQEFPSGYGNILRILILTVPCIAISNVLGNLYMLPNNMEKQASNIMLIAGFFNVFVSLVVVGYLGVLGMAAVVLAVELLILVLMSYFVFNKVKPALVS